MASEEGQHVERKLQEVWRSGYCEVTVEVTRASMAAGGGGADRRIAHLQDHIRDCKDCLYAASLKNIEMRTAEMIGGDAVLAFLRGDDITNLPGFSEAFARAWASSPRPGPDFEDWISAKVGRRQYRRASA